MRAAVATRPNVLDERLLIVDRDADAFFDARVRDFPSHVQAGDLVVVNDARTIPASLAGTGPEGEAMEVRLAGRAKDGAFRAVLFGDGDWRTPTEHRPPPPVVRAGDALTLVGLTARVVRVFDLPRLVELRFDGRDDAMWRAIFGRGKYVQYAYSSEERAPWDAQTPFAGEPWASEMPSAGRPFSFHVLTELGARGIEVARITHAAGLSSTGEATLDAALPLPERYRVPAETVSAIEKARGQNGRVIAIGTTVVRALEGATLANGGKLVAGEGTTDLVIGPGFLPRIVDGIVTGMHDRGASHFSLLSAFAPTSLLARAYDHADLEGYVCHELGDSCLILGTR